MPGEIGLAVGESCAAASRARQSLGHCTRSALTACNDRSPAASSSTALCAMKDDSKLTHFDAAAATCRRFQEHRTVRVLVQLSLVLRRASAAHAHFLLRSQLSRTNLLLFWSLSNGILAAAAPAAVSGTDDAALKGATKIVNGYLAFVLFSVAGLAAFPFIGETCAVRFCVG